ncbi:LysE family translocator [Psychrobacter sp. FDAARGOS_221]|uniref:LysE family translocator n=1 Tax=Psychrobacter sp. FDAARGOS_221 TaxID=1975705 RepID=UPI000BB56E2F|nr:LysE family translocator [Psychrobacter sp. FDAARGOS_221]PNK60287.1 LysE family translocator [Psychrobacter sp. FDAARGOS_221]
MTITSLQLLTFIIAVFVFIMTPGPGVFATIAKAMTQGAWSALPLAIGLAAGDTIYMVFSAYGLSALATNFNTAFTVIKVVGAAYLFYLAYKMWTTVPPKINTADVLVKQKNQGAKSILSGFLISISNPKVILFYVSLLPSFFPITELNALDITALCAVIFIWAIICMMIYAFMASYAQKQLKSSTARQRFNRVGASFMGLAGAWLVAKG